MIWKFLDNFETVRKNGKWSGKIRTVYQVFLLYAQKNSEWTKKFQGGNATLLRRFLHLPGGWSPNAIYLLLDMNQVRWKTWQRPHWQSEFWNPPQGELSTAHPALHASSCPNFYGEWLTHEHGQGQLLRRGIKLVTFVKTFSFKFLPLFNFKLSETDFTGGPIQKYLYFMILNVSWK